MNLPDVQVPPRKRRKVRLACTPCRSRKTGCDGQRPICSSCCSKGWHNRCTYQQSVLNATPLTISGASQTPQGIDNSPRLISSASLPQGRPGLSNAERSPPLDQYDQAGAPPGQTVSNNGHNRHVSSAASCQDGDETMYGPSSNVSFVRQVASVADPQTSTHNELSDEDTHKPMLLGFPTAQKHSPELLPENSVFMLPERWLADSLSSAFWEFVHPVFPILHSPSFEGEYLELWKPVITQRRDFKITIFQSTVSIVLALGAQRSEMRSANQLATRFYQQSHRLISIDTLDQSSLQVVQLMLLRGLYLHYTSHADRCWNTVGVALRMAQGLGLHFQREDIPSGVNQLKSEMRRRVWHCCVTLDRLTATTFGRPVLLSKRYHVPLPAAIDDEFINETGKGIQPESKPSRLTFFIQSLALFDILFEILHNFYSNRDQEGGESTYETEQLGHVLRLSSKLDNFVSYLPRHLREACDNTVFDDETARCFQMQVNIIKSRVLWIRLLLLRPSLLAESKRCANSRHKHAAGGKFMSLQNSFDQSINQLCIAAAHDVLQEMNEILGSPRQNSAWHVLLFTFAAASTLVAASLCPELKVSFDVYPSKASWERALRIFEFHKGHVASADRGIETLKKFRSCVSIISKRKIQVDGSVPEPISRRNPSTMNPPTFEEPIISPQLQEALLPPTSLSNLYESPPMEYDFSQALNSDLLNESWFNAQGIDFNDWSLWQ